MVVLCYGYSSWRPTFSVSTFFSFYTLVLVDPCLFVGWKLLKRTKWVGKYEADLMWERPTIDAYEATFIDPPVGFWREILQLFGLKKIQGGNDKRQASIVN